MNLQHERLSALIEYAKQTALLKKTPVSNISQHKDFSCLEDRIMGLPGVSVHLASGDGNAEDDDDVWMRVERLHESEPPVPADKHLAAWLELSRNPAKEPTLKPVLTEQQLIDGGLWSAADPIDLTADDPLATNSTALAVVVVVRVTLEEYEEQLALEFAPALKALLKSYLSTQWKPWAEKEKAVRKSIAFYSELFMLSQKLQGNLVDTALEFVWGVGVALQKTDAATVIYPLMTQTVELTLDDKTMALEIRPGSQDTRLELDIYAAQDNLGVAKLEVVGKKFLEAQPIMNPADPSTYEPLLRSAASMLDGLGVYWPDQIGAGDRSLPKANDNLCVTDTWVLLARPRASNLMVQDLARFETAMASGEAPEVLPGALQALFLDPATENTDIELPAFRGLSAVSGNGNSSKKSSELYFPKAYNDEQVQIIQMLEMHDGVVVQGPPGTGKTHTIANVICHYLASGKRVLVTSMKDPALAVLQEKLPESIRPLAVSLLSSEADGMRQFDFAISKIAAEVTRIDRVASGREIESIAGQIDATHASLAKIDYDIAKWARLNLDKIDLDGESLSPVEVAEEVARNRENCDWFPDTLTIAPSHKPQFHNDSIVSLRAARQAVGADLVYLGKPLPVVNAFPATGRLLQVHTDLRQLAELKAQEASGQIPRLSDLHNAIPLATEALGSLATLRELSHAIGEVFQPWVASLQLYLRKHEKSEILDLFFALRDDVLAALEKRKQFLARPVSVPDGVDTNAEIYDAVENLSEGRKPFGLAGLFGKSSEKKVLEAITVVGVKPASEAEWQHVKAFLDYAKQARVLVIRWNTLANEISLPVLESKVSALVKAGDALELVAQLQRHMAMDQAVSHQVKGLIPTWQKAGQTPMSEDMVEAASAILSQHLTQHRLAETWRVKEEMLDALNGCEGEITQQIRNFLTGALGSATISGEQLQQLWSQHLQELRRLHALSSELNAIKATTDLIRASGAANWATRLEHEVFAGTVDPLLPDNWSTVWRICRLIHFVDQTDGRQELKRLSRQRGEQEADLSKLYQQAISTRTWLKLAEAATPDVRSALEAYRTAIKKIGKGTGIRTGRFRQDARQASERANKAIPCWIMPHYRISESLPAQLGSFDLVIIDEASQSDLTALPAILRAKKILVVGDDQQVSPDGVGLEEAKIKNLVSRFLYSQVDIFRPQMTPDRSMYDLFKVVFANSAVMLREHFRCVTPIIEYSKREFYKHELKPLRMPARSERLDPPLVDVYVEDGFRNKEVNLPEAQFIVQEIKEIVANPAMAGRTIGVVSLIGSEQALRIMQMLNEELGEKLVTQFKITCGDARTFQGKERDIMFLSMIAAPGNAHAQTQTATAQRFNVAASRARDRMYLVRSIRAEELSQADVLRAKLIQHFQAPFLQNEHDLSTNRSKCESGFEREVYDILTEKGYRVIPQVPVGAYRIDMVVEGDNDGRLAIECDGDMYHGPEQWDNDMRRQRILERAGWKFWRSFASTFVLHKEQVVAELIEALTDLDIHPTTIDAPVASIHVESRSVRMGKQVDVEEESVPEGDVAEDAETAVSA